MTDLIVGSLAGRDIRAAVAYYEAARTGLGDRFLDALDRLFHRLELFPESAQAVAGYAGVRRALVSGFPYAVFYRHIGDRIDVLRVLHTARSIAGEP